MSALLPVSADLDSRSSAADRSVRSPLVGGLARLTRGRAAAALVGVLLLLAAAAVAAGFRWLPAALPTGQRAAVAVVTGNESSRTLGGATTYSPRLTWSAQQPSANRTRTLLPAAEQGYLGTQFVAPVPIGTTLTIGYSPAADDGRAVLIPTRHSRADLAAWRAGAGLLLLAGSWTALAVVLSTQRARRIRASVPVAR
jgi:uncharacterized membrane protein YphA (DoxX/SURF4 family)